ncbi:hypothetical protein TWF481_005433 [Arthrobotrys musiformis]|uniref:Integral membrane protein n=1 Tax=Arthrobotrys musiformis TaxID=47236 RepID=A0AAV9WEY3_9PEZI
MSDAWVQSLILSKTGEHILTYTLLLPPSLLLPLRLRQNFSIPLIASFILLLTISGVHTYHHSSPTPKTQLTAEILILTAGWCNKLSLLLLLPSYKKRYALLGICTAVWIAGVLGTCLSCFPVSRRGDDVNVQTAGVVMDVATYAIIPPFLANAGYKNTAGWRRCIPIFIILFTILLLSLGILRIIILQTDTRVKSTATAQFDQIFIATAMVFTILPGLLTPPRGKVDAAQKESGDMNSGDTLPPPQLENEVLNPDTRVLNTSTQSDGYQPTFPEPTYPIPPLQVKLQQVIPDIGGETSPVIRIRKR